MWTTPGTFAITNEERRGVRKGDDGSEMVVQRDAYMIEAIEKTSTFLQKTRPPNMADRNDSVHEWTLETPPGQTRVRGTR